MLIAASTDAAFKFAFKDSAGNAISSVKAGDVVDLYVSIKTEGYSPVFQIVFCYDYTLLTHIRQNGTAVQSITANNCRELLGDFADKTTQIEDDTDPIWQFENEEIGNGYYKLWGAGTSTATPHKDTMYPSTWGDTEKAQYKCISFGYMTDTADSVLTVNTNGEFYEMVRFRFLALADTKLDSDVVFNNPDAAKSYIAIDPDDAPISCAQYNSAVKVSNLTYEYDVAPSVVVSHVKQQSKWNGGKVDAANYLFGFVGQVSGLELTTTTNETTGRAMVNEISAITATATYNGGTAVADVVTVWAVEGGYQFRAQFAGFQPTDAKEVSVVFAITMSDGTTVYESASETKAINAIYAASVTNGLPELA